MKKQLIPALEAVAGEQGFRFYAGDESRINTLIDERPALWLANNRKCTIEGISEGIETIALRIILIEKAASEPGRQRIGQWHELERKALEICRKLAAEEWVKHLSGTKFEAAENSLTNRGEISLAIETNIHVPFGQL